MAEDIHNILDTREPIKIEAEVKPRHIFGFLANSPYRKEFLEDILDRIVQSYKHELNCYENSVVSKELVVSTRKELKRYEEMLRVLRG